MTAATEGGGEDRSAGPAPDDPPGDPAADTPAEPSPPDRHVITGASRLTARVAAALLDRGSEVVVVIDDAPAHDKDNEDTSLLPEGVREVRHPNRTEALRLAGLPGARSFLVLGPDDSENLRLVGVAAEIDPAVPVVVRLFNPEFADHLADRWNIRRAYSLSALAAPALVAAALGEGVLDALRLGDDVILLAVADVGDASHGILHGHTPDEVKQRSACAVVAVADAGGKWRTDPPDHPLQAGERLAVGGLMHDVLALARDHRLDEPATGSAASSRARSTVPRWQRRLLPICLTVFVALLALTALVYSREYDLGGVEALHAALATTLGSPPPADNGTATTLFAIATTLTGLALLSVIFSIVAARLIEVRLDERMGRQARRMQDHIIVAGLGRVGFRVVRLLRELDIEVVALEREEGSPFREAAAADGPVLIGDARLAEDLRRAGVERARCVIACTDDDLSNLGACLEARRLRPDIRTVARVFDDDLADVVGPALGIDVVASTSEIACSAFVAAATDGRAARTVQLGDLVLNALRVEPQHDLGAGELANWRQRGLRVLASRREGEAARPPTTSLGRGLAAQEEAIVVGPPEVVAAVVPALEQRADP